MGESPDQQSEVQQSDLQQPQKRAGARRLLRVAFAGLLVFIALLLGLAAYLRSSAFQEMVRRRVVSGLEQALGVRAELGAFSFDWTRLQARLQGLVLHGRQRETNAADQPPLFAAQEIEAAWTLLSVWTLSTEFDHIRVTQPRVSVIFYEDGSNNLPSLPPREGQQGRWAEQLIGLRIGSIEVADGEIAWNQQRVPLDFQADDLDLRMAFSPATQQPMADGAAASYEGSLALSDATFQLRKSATLPLSANVQFHLYPDRAVIDALDLRTDKSHIQSSVNVNSFRSADLSIRYDMQLDWHEVDQLIRSDGGSSGWQGTIRWQGQGALGREGLRLDGGLSVRTVRNGIRNWEHIPWSMRSQLTVTRGRNASNGTDEPGESSPILADVREMTVEAVGGQLRGSASVKYEGGIALTVTQLQAEQLSYAEVALAMRALPVRLERLPWDGTMAGPVQASFAIAGARSGGQRMVRDLRLEAEMNVESPLAVPEGIVPISGMLKGTYLAETRRLENVEVKLALPGTRLTASGWAEELQSAMQLGFDSTNLEVNRPLGELFRRGFTELPMELGGRARASVEWTGGWRAPRLRGPFEVVEFFYNQTRWDQFSGRLDFRRRAGEEIPPETLLPAAEAEMQTPRESRAEVEIAAGRLQREDALAEFDLHLELLNGRVVPASEFRAEGRVRNARLEDLQTLAGANYPLTGLLEAEFSASGTRQNPLGQGRVRLTGGSLYDEPFSQLTADLSISPGPVITANPITLAKGGTVAGRVVVRPNERQFEVDLTATRVPLAEIRLLQSSPSNSRPRLAGMVDGRVTGGGSFANPQLQGELTLREAGEGIDEPAAGVLRDGRLSVQFETAQNRARWRADGELFGGQVEGTGEAALEAPYPLTARINLSGADLPALIRLQREPPAGLAGRIDGTATLRMNGGAWSTATVEGELTRLDVSRMGVAMRNSEPVRLRYANQLVQVENLHAVGDQVDLRASGTIRASADPALNLTARGQIDLAALSKLDPQVAIAGQSQLDAQISGTLGRPQWRGRLQVLNASAQFGRLANSLTAIRGAVVFEGNRGELDGFRAESGGGVLLISGNLRYGEGAGIQFNLNAAARNVRIRYPEEMSTWVDGQLNWTGSIRTSLLEGRATITRQSVTPPNDLAQVLLRRRGEAAVRADSPFLRGLRLNLEVESAPEVRLDTRSARNLQTAVEARIQGTGEQPAILGRVGVLGGEIEFAGKRYTINRGEVSFLNPFRFEPLLSLNVQARVQQYDITMDFSGPPDRLNVTYRSDPPLPTRDILALLVAGGGRQTSLQPSATPQLPQVNADSLLSQALSTQIGSRLDRIFGAGRVRVDPQITGLGSTTTATLALEQQFRNNLTLLYVTDVSSAEQQYVQAEWIISPKLSVVGIRDQNGLIGVNFQITLRFE